MKSTIKIDLDANYCPVIEVKFEPSEDVRDKMVGIFLRNATVNWKEGILDYETALIQLSFSSHGSDGSAVAVIKYLSTHDLQNPDWQKYLDEIKKIKLVHEVPSWPPTSTEQVENFQKSEVQQGL